KRPRRQRRRTRTRTRWGPATASQSGTRRRRLPRRPRRSARRSAGRPNLASRRHRTRYRHRAWTPGKGARRSSPAPVGSSAATSRSPYAASKVGADKLMESFHHSFELPVAIARPFNTYGPHQSARAIIPTIATQALRGSRVRLGLLEPRRDLTYVTDTAAGLMA